MERLNYNIQVGEKYINRIGVEMYVIKQVKDKFLVTNPVGTYNVKDYGDGYFVGSKGGFGNTPNGRDLIKKTNK